jgi:hypothetical protein
LIGSNKSSELKWFNQAKVEVISKVINVRSTGAVVQIVLASIIHTV